MSNERESKDDLLDENVDIGYAEDERDKNHTPSKENLNEKFSRRANKLYAQFIFIVGTLLMFLGIGIFALQVFLFLKFGVWSEIPLGYLVVFAPEEIARWFNNPASWVGLHKMLISVLNFIPLSLFSFFLGTSMMTYDD